MGEIAEMMLDGTLCEGCGEFLGGGSPGYPRYCRDCRIDNKVATAKVEKVSCPHCKKRVKKVGLSDHIRDVHQK